MEKKDTVEIIFATAGNIIINRNGYEERITEEEYYSIYNNDKCIVHGCTNKKEQGNFVGDICKPCYKMITEGDIEQPTNNFIGKLTNKNKEFMALIKDVIKHLESIEHYKQFQRKMDSIFD